MADETSPRRRRPSTCGGRTAEEEYDRMVEHLKSACATCMYGFPVAIGHSCGITKKVTSNVIVKCGAYKRASWVELMDK